MSQKVKLTVLWIEADQVIYQGHTLRVQVMTLTFTLHVHPVSCCIFYDPF